MWCNIYKIVYKLLTANMWHFILLYVHTLCWLFNESCIHIILKKKLFTVYSGALWKKVSGTPLAWSLHNTSSPHPARRARCAHKHAQARIHAERKKIHCHWETTFYKFDIRNIRIRNQCINLFSCVLKKTEHGILRVIL